ncbi:hypothetical protein [Psychrosphaera haliotis]|uniref:Uncharacterized protein n=1 Tax=Psychrosphaera haliotis TaxID=555083 RepID=A0A6N8F923_9GAMM|nr:hypothetical protein [Psychrosphaera haliotis]MUH71041.1 hypothetical protein [Psychrosphaera haliotis]
MTELSKEERLKRARNKMRLMRRQIDDAKQKQLKLKNLVRVYVSQRQDVSVAVIKRWLDQ